MVLNAAAAVVSYFRAEGDRAWPGFDLSRRPFVLYDAGRWAAVINAPASLAGFEPWPDGWPTLGTPGLLHRGAIEGLVGQLAFDYDLAGIRTVAVPVVPAASAGTEDLTITQFAFIVHEAFHQYQQERFDDTDSPSEEGYPLLDVRNNALATLEMQALLQAVDAREDTARSRRELASFKALRAARAGRLDSATRELERIKERLEGTAKYVEVQAVAGLVAECRRVPGRWCLPLAGVTDVSYLRKDFASRLQNGAIDPEDMPRNRIYPVGAALGLLLDGTHPGWKAEAEQQRSYSLAAVLTGDVPTGADQLTAAMRRLDYVAAEHAARERAEVFRKAFATALAAFEAQGGLRLEVVLPTSGLTRSRSSTGRRWIMDRGATVLGERYTSYVLRSADGARAVQVRQAAVLELRPAGSTSRTIVCYVPAVDSLMLDGIPDRVVDGSRRFERLALRGSNVTLELVGPGLLRSAGNRTRVELVPR